MKFYYILLFFIVFISCTKGPYPIEYGRSKCHFCQQVIKDARYAAEVLHQSGRYYFYNTIECMLKEAIQNRWIDSLSSYALFVKDFLQPHEGHFIEIRRAVLVYNPHYTNAVQGHLLALSHEEQIARLQGESIKLSFKAVLDSLAQWHFLKY